MNLDGIEIKRAMVIFAHPDDGEFGSSGTVAKWVRGGVEVVYVMVTNGGSGSSDPAMTRKRLIEIRREEQLAAAKVLGVTQVEFLGFEDGYLEPTLEVRKAVARVIRKWRPDVVISPDPTFRYHEWGYINHPDHIAVGEVVMRSMNPDAPTRLMFPELADDEGLEPHKPKALLLVRWGQDANHHEDISEVIELKIKALECHISQVGDFEVAEFVRERARSVGAAAQVDFAEAFYMIRLGG